MTAIAGIAQNGHVWIGGDSAGVSGLDLTVRKDTKVFRNGPMIFGFTHSFRTLQLFRHALQIPQRHPDTDIERWMVTTFVDAARECLKGRGFSRTASGGDNNGIELGTYCLIGYEGRLFSLMGDWQIGESATGYDAAGCADSLCLGSLHTTATTDLDPRQRITAALTAAEAWSAGVRAPFHIVTTQDNA